MRPHTIEFTYKGKPQSHTFTPESEDDWGYWDSENLDERFHWNYDEDYMFIVVYVYDKESDEIDYTNTIFKKEL